jgi:hypothetical protein
MLLPWKERPTNPQSSMRGSRVWPMFPKKTKTLWGIWIGEHRQEGLAKFGYRSKRKVEKFRIHLIYIYIYWRHFETYSCLNGDLREAVDACFERAHRKILFLRWTMTTTTTTTTLRLPGCRFCFCERKDTRELWKAWLELNAFHS